MSKIKRNITPKINGMKHMKTSKNIKSFRSSNSRTGVSMKDVYVQRLSLEDQRLNNRRNYRIWLNEQMEFYKG